MMDALWLAICMVESGRNPRAVGDHGQAVGIAQIQPVMVRDCNRLAGFRRWTLADRYSVFQSRAMFDLYLAKYGRGKSLQAKARIWNGGPRGDKKRATIPYWRKIREAMKGTACRFTQ